MLEGYWHHNLAVPEDQFLGRPYFSSAERKYFCVDCTASLTSPSGRGTGGNQLTRKAAHLEVPSRRAGANSMLSILSHYSPRDQTEWTRSDYTWGTNGTPLYNDSERNATGQSRKGTTE